MRNKLRVGIAGYGVVGKRRRTCIDQNPYLTTVAVSDQNIEFGVTEDGVRSYQDSMEMLSDQLDVVFVSLPNHAAPAISIAALRKGCHVFCEKPPGRNVGDVIAVQKAERENSGLKLKYGFNHRYHDSVIESKKLIDGGSLGSLINLRGVYGKSQIISFESDWRTRRAMAGGGILLDQGIHIIDLMRLFSGEFPDVHSFISNSYWQHDVEDNAYALMRTATGVVGMLHSSATQWRHQFRLELALTEGAIILGGILSGSKSYGDETMTTIKKSEDGRGMPKREIRKFGVDHSWQDEIDEFADAIWNDKPIIYGNSADALATMELTYRIYCADKGWKERYALTC